MWSWLSNPDNQKTLAFVGGGLSAAAGAAWAVIKFFGKKPHTSVKADRGGIAAGRDAIVGLPPKSNPRD